VESDEPRGPRYEIDIHLFSSFLSNTLQFSLVLAAFKNKVVITPNLRFHKMVRLWRVEADAAYRAERMGPVPWERYARENSKDISECALDNATFHTYIENNGTLDDLEQEVVQNICPF